MYKALSIFLFCFIFILSSCNQIEKKDFNSVDSLAIFDSLTIELDSIQRNGKINGFAVAMVNQNGVLYSKGFGTSNSETNEKYTSKTVQHIASVSKTLIGIALMKAKELEKLDLDDPINKYLSFNVFNPKYPNEIITIRQLATHTSGINDTDEYMNRAWIVSENQDLSNISTDYPYQKLNLAENDMPMEEYLKEYLVPDGEYYLPENYIDFKPGQRYNYSNIGATLCALIIEKATDQSFDSFTRIHILGPLNMNDSGWSLDSIDITNHSRLYRNDNSLLPYYKAITYPDGMLISSSDDMAKYLVELIKGYSGNGTLLNPESYKELFTEQLNESHFESRDPNHPYNGDYSPAIFIGHSAPGYIGHSGGDAGVATWMYFNKEEKTGRYIVINCDMGNDNRSRELEYYAIWDTMNKYFK
ncbi:serine hydrolase domain-containing protein [Marinigracilibium pacificum]|uniref:Beta-lactamase family protein n=1 Tax=Marinigracilibium pacificum TaxID=2729599 RepID=A0A848IZN5_9BACT|nr:serine hydrolase domain-containing protein [Marinigracilibium pacificum]NMM47760.1 beta-lactamase family protein [Marinigracilibium pacificum]